VSPLDRHLIERETLNGERRANGEDIAADTRGHLIADIRHKKWTADETRMSQLQLQLQRQRQLEPQLQLQLPLHLATGVDATGMRRSRRAPAEGQLEPPT
jgi:hypothetical protein